MEENFVAGFVDELEKIAYGAFGTVGKALTKPGLLKTITGVVKKRPVTSAAIGAGAGGLLLGRASKD